MKQPSSSYFETVHDPEIMRRFQVTMELFQAAHEIQRQNILRREPTLSAEEVDQRLQDWLLHRPEDHGSPTFRLSRRFAHLFDG